MAQKMNELRGEERLIGGKEMLEFKSFIGKNVGTLGSLLFKLTDHVSLSRLVLGKRNGIVHDDDDEDEEGDQFSPYLAP